ncbi:winged helix-turn-helix domain-containing protein [Stenotrophomonas muris]|uniref:winged helix-turn-helix domain-containing protein n=1 Tax=Stenotrophomonas muris TaxID=2963283 RepID=UPI003F87F647
MNHPARSTDPQCSHIAAAALAESGALRVQHAKTEAAVIRHPGQSSLHLSTLTVLGRHMLGRLPELARVARIGRAPIAPSATTGKPACTWWPVAPGENLTLGL